MHSVTSPIHFSSSFVSPFPFPIPRFTLVVKKGEDRRQRLNNINYIKKIFKIFNRLFSSKKPRDKTNKKKKIFQKMIN